MEPGRVYREAWSWPGEATNSYRWVETQQDGPRKGSKTRVKWGGKFRWRENFKENESIQCLREIK